jgi:O-antigen/teichoic acid export membrane protein
MRRSFIFSVIAEIGASLSMILTFRLASEFWGVAGFAEWIMARRLIAFVVPVMTMGMDVGLPRAVASSLAGLSHSYLAAASLVVTVMIVGVAAIMIPLASFVSQVIFGDAEHSRLVMPVVIMSAAYALYVLLYGFMRGRLQIMQANFAHIFFNGVLPLALIWLVHDSVELAISTIGVVVAVVTVAYLGSCLWSSFKSIDALPKRTHELADYGVPRMLAAILLMSLSLVPASIAAYRSGIEAGGFIALTLSIVGIAGCASAPIQVILLPLASSMWADGRRHELKNAFRRLEWVIVLLGALAFVIVPFVTPIIAMLVLGERNQLLEHALSFAGLAIGPFMYFVCGRQIVDACTARGINTRNLLLAGVCFLASLMLLYSFGVDDVAAIMLSYSVAMLVLAVATAHAVRGLVGSVSLGPDVD